MRTFTDWDADGGLQMGAALAYYTLFSLAPLALIAMALAGMVTGHAEIHAFVAARVREAVGLESTRAIDELMLGVSRSMSTRAASGLGVVLLLLGASGAVGELRGSLNRIWKVVPARGALAAQLETQLISLAFMLATGALLVASLLLSAGAASVEKRFTGRMTLPVGVLRVLNTGGSFTLVTALCALIYKLLPEVRIAWRDVWTGAATTAFLLVAGDAVLGSYLGGLSGASSYGAAGALVLVLAWTYYCAQMLYLGAEFTRVYSLTRESAAASPAASAPPAL